MRVILIVARHDRNDELIEALLELIMRRQSDAEKEHQDQQLDEVLRNDERNL